MFHVGLHVCNVIHCVNPAYYAAMLIKSINQSINQQSNDDLPQVTQSTGRSQYLLKHCGQK